MQGKTRVAPVKSTTIPRLELCGAHLSTMLLDIVQQSFRDVDSIHFWTDSTTVLRWLPKSTDHLKTFESLRSQKKTIQNGYKWKWTPGKDNPADLASRGVPPSELSEAELWWKGPFWFSLDESEWPIQSIPSKSDDEDEDPEIKPLINHIGISSPLTRGPWFQHNKPCDPTPLLET